jgi:small nuclear ribonucleoprotein (snRNP)-like protein
VRKRLLNKAVLRRFAVTLRGIDETFSGVLTLFDADMFVFENCRTVVTTEGATAVNIPGRLFVERKTVAYLQELPS